MLLQLCKACLSAHFAAAAVAALMFIVALCHVWNVRGPRAVSSPSERATNPGGTLAFWRPLMGVFAAGTKQIAGRIKFRKLPLVRQQFFVGMVCASPVR